MSGHSNKYKLSIPGWLAERVIPEKYGGGVVVLSDSWKEDLPGGRTWGAFRWLVQHFPSERSKTFRSQVVAREAFKACVLGMDQNDIVPVEGKSEISNIEKPETEVISITSVINDTIPLRELIGIMANIARNGESEGIRAMAARDLLDRGWGKAVNRQETIVKREGLDVVALLGNPDVLNALHHQIEQARQPVKTVDVETEQAS